MSKLIHLKSFLFKKISPKLSYLVIKYNLRLEISEIFSHFYSFPDFFIILESILDENGNGPKSLKKSLKIEGILHNNMTSNPDSGGIHQSSSDPNQSKQYVNILKSDHR